MMTFRFKEKKMNLAERGRDFLEQYPDATAIDLIEHCGFKLPYAKTFLWSERNKPVDRQGILNKKAKKHLEDILKMPPVPPSPDWKMKYDAAVHHIRKLEEQIIGYKAVIDYLEHQIAMSS